MIFAFDDFELDAETPELKRDGQPVKADVLVLRLLAVLVRNAGQLVTKQELVAQVWDNRAVSENVITVSMVRLRKTLGHGQGNELVSNVRGRGYRFVRPVTARAAQPAPLLARALPSTAGPPFVGRERVLARLRERWQRAAAGQGGACVLIGEPGIGKTRAIEMVAREAEGDGLLVAWGHCREAGDTPPLWPFAQITRSLLARVPFDTLAVRLGSASVDLARLLPELSSARAAEHGERHDPGVLHGHAGRHRMIDALSRTFALVAEQVPCVLVLDDLQRADAASLELLRYLIDELAHARVALLASLRPAPIEQTGTHLAYVLGHRNCERVALERLREQDVRTYVGALLEDPQGRFGRAVFAQSEGNPFFMVELARQLRDGEGAGAGLPAWSERAPLREERVALPVASLELVRQRLAALDGDTRDALACAAVIGRRFELPLLRAVAAGEPDALLASLDRACRHGVIDGTPKSPSNYAFSHELLRAVLYDALEPGARRALHLRVVAALEERRRSGDPVLPGELAYHAHAALPDGNLSAVIAHCDAAAIAAARVYANADVVRYLRHALDALELMAEPNPALRLGLMLRQALFARADSPVEFERLIVEIVRSAREQRSGVLLAWAALLLEPHPGFPSMVRVPGALEDALRLLGDQHPHLRAALLARLTTSAPLAYDEHAARAQLEQARALCGADGDLLGRYAIVNAELYLSGGPHADGAGERALQAHERLCRENQLVLSIPPVLAELHSAIVALQSGRIGHASEALERAAARCRAPNSRELYWHIERFQLLQRIHTGAREQALPALSRLHQRAEHERILGTALFCAFDRSVICAQPVDPDQPELALALDDPPSVWALRVRTLSAAGLHDRARAALRSVAPERLVRLPRDRDHLGTLGALARSAVQLQTDEYLEPLYRLLAPYPEHFAVHVSFLCEASVSQLLGELARALGRSADADRHSSHGAALARRCGFVLP